MKQVIINLIVGSVNRWKHLHMYNRCLTETKPAGIQFEMSLFNGKVDVVFQKLKTLSYTI